MNKYNLLIIALFIILLAHTACKQEDDNGLPVVTTSEVNNISITSASSGGNVISDGNALVTGRGVCWSTSQNPTIANNRTNEGQGVGTFSSNIANLTAGTTYYLRAYATNKNGTTYGEQRIFTTTTVNISLPVVSTDEVSDITDATATCGGNVTSDGNSVVTAKGVCWSTSQNPEISGNHTSDGSGIGSFTSNISGLTANTTYYVRAYATNSAGTAYGEEKTFTTTSINSSLPVVATNAVSNITSNSATCGGNVTSDGNSAVTAKGVCWSTSQNPTIANSKTNDGQGLGQFISSITGLTTGTTYYVRAYATNSNGTAYGVQRTFTTNALPGWRQRANFAGAARSYAVGFSINDRGYIGTGHKYYNSSTYEHPSCADMWEYSKSTNSWAQKANFTDTRHYAICFAIGSKGYVGLGMQSMSDNISNSYKNDLWEYNPSTNYWTQKANFSGITRIYAVGFSIGSKGYVGTGYNYGNMLRDFWEYNPSTNTWTQKSNFGGSARSGAVGFSIGDKGYIGTGYDGYNLCNDFWEYNPSTNTWTQKSNFGGPARKGAVGFSVGDNGYIGTGELNAMNTLNDFWEYTPE
jgi:hypothetical protein